MPLPRQKLPTVKKRRHSKAATWLNLEQRLEKLDGVWCEGELLNLPGWRTSKYRETADDITVMAEATSEVSTPCNCGSITTNVRRWGFTNPSYVHDLPIRSKRVRVYFRLRRNRCLKCGLTTQQSAISMHEKRAMTSRLVEYIERESFSMFRSFSHLADEVGCSEQTIRNMFTARASQLEVGRCINTPEWIAIDEVYPRKNTKYCVLSDPIGRQIIDILPDDNPNTLKMWLLHLPDRHKVKVVTTDMFHPYRAAVRRLIPRAHVIVDRYHVHNLLSVALKQVLDVVRDSMTYSEQRKFMRREHLLLTNYRRLSGGRTKDKHGRELMSQKEAVRKWLNQVPDVARAYQLAKSFSDILQLSDREKAEKMTDTWLERASEFVDYFRAKYKKSYSGKWQDPFGNIPNTITDWRASILDYISYRDRYNITPTNAFAEFANKQIKRAYRTGNGYTFEVLRLKTVYGGILVAKRPPHPLDHKLPRATSKRSPKPEERGRHTTNPDANIMQLAKAREDRYVSTQMSLKPQDNAAWMQRFRLENICRKDVEADTELAAQTAPAEPILQEELFQRPGDKRERIRRPNKFNPDQIKMF